MWRQSTFVIGSDVWKPKSLFFLTYTHSFPLGLVVDVRKSAWMTSKIILGEKKSSFCDIFGHVDGLKAGCADGSLLWIIMNYIGQEHF